MPETVPGSETVSLSTSFRCYFPRDTGDLFVDKLEGACLSFEIQFGRLPDIALLSMADLRQLRQDSNSITAPLLRRGVIAVIAADYIPCNAFYLGINGVSLESH